MPVNVSGWSTAQNNHVGMKSFTLSCEDDEDK